MLAGLCKDRRRLSVERAGVSAVLVQTGVQMWRELEQDNGTKMSGKSEVKNLAEFFRAVSWLPRTGSDTKSCALAQESVARGTQGFSTGCKIQALPLAYLLCCTLISIITARPLFFACLLSESHFRNVLQDMLLHIWCS